MQQQAEKKHKRKRDRKKRDHQPQAVLVHISHRGLTIAVDTTKLRDGELGQLLETLAIETKTRSQTRHKELDENEKEQVDFLIRCRNLAQSMIPGPAEVDTDKPLEESYQLFESVVSALQKQMQNTREEKKEEISQLLMQQHTTFSKAYKVLRDHMEESVITEGVLWDWPSYYGQVFQQTRQTR